MKSIPSCREEEQIQTKYIKQRISPLPQRHIERDAGNLQNKEVINGISEAPPSVEAYLKSTKGSGQPLPKSVRDFFEPRFGYDFNNVRVHTDNKANESTQAVNAMAYTVKGDIVFDTHRYDPQSGEGIKLLAHELAHIVQQGGTGSHVLYRQSTPPAPVEQQEEEKKKSSEVILGGVKIAAEQLIDNNPKVEELFIKPFEKKLKRKLKALPPGEIALYGGFLGSNIAPLLIHPEGRKFLEGALEGFNLATPLGVIPYMPLTGFKYTLPSGETEEKRLLHFETKFSADDYLKLFSEHTRLPNTSLQFNLQWGYDPESKQLRALGGQAEIGLMPGVSLGFGRYPSLFQPPQVGITPEGSTVEARQRIPELAKPMSGPDVRVIMTVDLRKLDPSVIGRKIHEILKRF